MRLKFFAREAAHVRELGVHRYYGRSFDPKTGEWPVTREAFEVEAGTPDADKAARACRDGDLFAADAETARVCGVEFVATEFKGGTYVVAAQTKSAAKVAKEEAS